MNILWLELKSEKKKIRYNNKKIIGLNGFNPNLVNFRMDDRISRLMDFGAYLYRTVCHIYDILCRNISVFTDI